MDIWETNKLALFVAFVIPGFVSLKSYELLFFTTAKDSANQLIDAIAYSCLNYAILFPVIYYVNLYKINTEHPIWFAFFCFLIFFCAPVIWVCILRFIRQSTFLQRWLPHPIERPWDFIFAQKIPYWIIITMKDGKRLGGKYGPNSFTSSSPSKEQIYIEETWELNEDGGFERAKNTSAGTLIVSSDIESIEFFHWT